MLVSFYYGNQRCRLDLPKDVYQIVVEDKAIINIDHRSEQDTVYTISTLNDPDINCVLVGEKNKTVANKCVGIVRIEENREKNSVCYGKEPEEK